MTVDKIIICIVNVIDINNLNDCEFRGFSVSYTFIYVNKRKYFFPADILTYRLVTLRHTWCMIK